MNNENKRKKILNLFLRLVAVAVGIGLCIPVTEYFAEFLGSGEKEIAAVSGAVLCCGLIALILIALVAGIRALTGRPFKLTIGILAMTMMICIGAGVIFFRNIPDSAAENRTFSPRPTVTPPPVVIEEKEKTENPESGTIFYKKYYDNAAKLTIDNASSSDLYVKLRSKEGLVVLTFFVRANDTVTVNAPIGSYEYICAVGKEWEDDQEYFGDSTKFKKSKEICTLKWGDSCDISFSRGLTELLEVSRREFEK